MSKLYLLEAYCCVESFVLPGSSDRAYELMAAAGVPVLASRQKNIPSDRVGAY